MLKNRTVLVSLLFFAASACAREPQVIVEPVSEDFRVQVSSDGEPLRNPQQRLVHHVDLSKGAARTLATSVTERRALPFSASLERDIRGEASGVRVLAPRSRVTERLGLEPEDLITAVGRRRVASLTDVASLFVVLDQERTATVTLVRRGRPHKVFYKVQ